MKINITVVVFILALAACALAQSGGTFNIEKSVIAGGGGQASGGTFVLDGTVGQALAGVTSGGGTFIVESGFWTSAPNSLAGTVTYANAVGAPNPRFVSNVTLTGSGSPGVATTTNFPDGAYFLTGFGSGAYTVTPTKVGGTNGAITSFDAARIALHVAGPPNPQLNATQLIVADVSGNNQVTSFDAGMIAKYVAGPPFSNPGIGQTTTWKFTPTSRNYASVSGNLAGEDYAAYLMGDVSGNWANTGARTKETDGPEKTIAVRLPNMSAQASAGRITLPINIDGAANNGLVSYEFDLRYDPSVIQPEADPVDLAGTASRKLIAVSNATQPGLLRVVIYGPAQIERDGILLNLKFTAVGKSGSLSPLTLERIMFNEGGSRRVNTVSGQVDLF